MVDWCQIQAHVLSIWPAALARRPIRVQCISPSVCVLVLMLTTPRAALGASVTILIITDASFLIRASCRFRHPSKVDHIEYCSLPIDKLKSTTHIAIAYYQTYPHKHNTRRMAAATESRLQELVLVLGDGASTVGARKSALKALRTWLVELQQQRQVQQEQNSNQVCIVAVW